MKLKEKSWIKFVCFWSDAQLQLLHVPFNPVTLSVYAFNID